ncbi:MAG TPA: hypothetical protein VN328_09750 [Thermodesulfovibrionales bacterium]|nr:hypothetical protein [Thermodesulfovibrionales bacterium]
MSHDFTVTEENGEKLYKLIIVKFSLEGMKIVSKETFDQRIHFCIYFGKLDPDTGEFATSEPRYRSADKGVSIEEFETFVSEALAKFPANAEVIVNDLSKYLTVKEQFNEGMNKGFMNVVSMKGSIK